MSCDPSLAMVGSYPRALYAGCHACHIRWAETARQESDLDGVRFARVEWALRHRDHCSGVIWMTDAEAVDPGLEAD